ncbi:MAG: exopolyphosphatase [Flavobacteriales bacterium]|nr:exopolyphosphatase [Flavobacteriales bacterium]
MKFAAIDIGSNAIRLLIEEVYADEGNFHIEKVSLTRVPIRLGEDVFTNQKISKEKIRQLVKAMKAFWYLMDIHNVEHVRACATSAMREAKNSKEVIDKVLREANVSIELLSGAEEANLIFSNYIAQKLNGAGNYLYIDVGGGSTELTLIRNGKRVKARSFNVGTVRMLTAPVRASTWGAISNWIKSSLKRGEKLIAIGTGGNVNALHKLAGKKPGATMSFAELQELNTMLRSYSYDHRITRLRLKPDRADVILPAAEIYLRILRSARITEMLVPKIGLSDGMILEMFAEWKKEREGGKSG